MEHALSTVASRPPFRRTTDGGARAQPYVGSMRISAAQLAAVLADLQVPLPARPHLQPDDANLVRLQDELIIDHRAVLEFLQREAPQTAPTSHWKIRRTDRPA